MTLEAPVRMNPQQNGTGPNSPPASANGKGTTVELKGLSRSYGKVRALDGLDLRLEPGELVSLLGPSGCGKTTALRILAGFDRADSGHVLVDNADIGRTAAHRRDMGMVFQSYSLFPNLNATQNVAFGLRLRSIGRNERMRRARDLLELVGMGEHTDHFPHQLSGGQQQRVALARALAIEPRVLLLDEPLSALDAKVRAQLREHIRSLQQQLGITTLFVTHDQDEALSISDRVGVMNGGRLQQLGTPNEVYEHPTNAFVASFVGIASRLPATVRTDGGVDVLGTTLPPPKTSAPYSAGTDVEVLLRPEAVRVRPHRQGHGLITARSFYGSIMRVVVAIAGGFEVIASVAASDATELTIGTPVAVEPTRALFVSPIGARAVMAVEGDAGGSE